MYDIFYVSRTIGNDADWAVVKSKYSAAQRLSNIESFDQIKSRAFTKMFWVIWDDLILNNSFDLSEHSATKWDDQYVHVFKNGKHYDGIVLFSKNTTISKKEFDHRFFMNKKEIDIVASNPKPYDKFTVDTYAQYLEAKAHSTTDMFYMIPSDIRVLDDFKFDIYYSHHNTIERQETHALLNGDYYDGIFLVSKYTEISQKEIENKFIVERKEEEILASTPVNFDVCHINSYEDYINACEKSTTSMFWGVWSDVEIVEDFDFKYYVPRYNQHITHVFKNGEYYDGVCLFSKKSIVSTKEFSYRFFTNKKEIDIQASTPKPFDVVFISYHEPNADINYQLLTQKIGSNVFRVDGVKGIHNAHKQAANLVSTDMFWVVDADAIIVDDFKFDYQVLRHNYNTVYVWRSANPINNLEYGYGGVKLLPTKETLNMDMTSADMTTSISKNFKTIDQVSNITAFNTDSFNTWKSAFRECVKLSSRTIDRQNEDETSRRLDIWCSLGTEKPFGEDAIRGAKEGKLYGETHKGNIEALVKINDFDWLKGMFGNVK